jgi:hypothetical protein
LGTEVPWYGMDIRCRLHYQREGFCSGWLYFHLLFHSLLSRMLLGTPDCSIFLCPLFCPWLNIYLGDGLILCGWCSQGYDCTHCHCVFFGLGGSDTIVLSKVCNFLYNVINMVAIYHLGYSYLDFDLLKNIFFHYSGKECTHIWQQLCSNPLSLHNQETLETYNVLLLFRCSLFHM